MNESNFFPQSKIADPQTGSAETNIPYEEWKALYPGGKKSETYVLIKFSSSRIEVMDISRKVLESHFRPAIITLENSIWIHEK